MPAQLCSHLKIPFSNANTRYGTKHLLSGHDQSRSHKSQADVHHQNCLLSNAIMLKLPRPSFKSYIYNISLCEACFLKLKYPLIENVLSSSSTLTLSLQHPPRLSNYQMTHGTLIRKQQARVQCFSSCSGTVKY